MHQVRTTAGSGFLLSEAPDRRARSAPTKDWHDQADSQPFLPFGGNGESQAERTRPPGRKTVHTLSGTWF